MRVSKAMEAVEEHGLDGLSELWIFCLYPIFGRLLSDYALSNGFGATRRYSERTATSVKANQRCSVL